MFTGIITDVGAVREIEGDGGMRIVLGTGYEVSTLPVGASVACAGVCLTVVDTGPERFAVEASAETLACTILGDWRPGRAVNLEQALKVGDALGGHFVTGHVDGVARVLERVPDGDSLRLVIEAPAPLSRFISAKGAVTLDGVSLTVNEVKGPRFAVNVIPHTRTATTLGEARPGDRMNLEIDMLARYLDRLLEDRAGA